MQDEEISFTAGLQASLQSLTSSVNKARDWWETHSDIVYQTPVNAQITGTSAGAFINDSANTLNSNLQPDLGTCWSVRRLSVTGYTAGTVIVYLNAIEPVGTWTFGLVNPFNYYPKGGLLLQPGDRLTVGATGVTGVANIFGTADTFPYWYLRRYLD